MAFLRKFITRAAWMLVTLTAGLGPAQGSQHIGDASSERNRQFIALDFQDGAAGGTDFFQGVPAPDAIWPVEGTSPAAGTYHRQDDIVRRTVTPFSSRLATPVRPAVRDIWADGAPCRNGYVEILRMMNLHAKEVTAFPYLVAYDDVIRRTPLIDKKESSTMSTHNYTGMWVTDDGQVRHQLLPGGRYDEARGNRESAYRGRYRVTGRQIDYWDDTGFTADGVFVDENTLHHGGMVLRRR